MSPEERNKFIIISVMLGIIVLVGLSLLLAPRSRGRSAPEEKKTAVSYEDRLGYAREKISEGKTLVRKAEKADSSKTRNALLKEAEEIFWKARKIYSDILDNHEGKGYEYLETEVTELQMFIFHCQKTRTIERE